MQIPYALLGFGALAGFVVCWSLHQLWKRTLGLFFDWLAELAIPLPKLPDVHPFGVLHRVNVEIDGALAKFAAATERAMVTLLGQTLRSFLALAGEVGALAEAVERKLVGLVSATIPRLVRSALGAVWGQLKRIPKLVARLDNLARWVERKIKAAAAAAGRYALKLGGKALHYARVAFGKLWKAHRWLLGRVLALEKRLTPKGLRKLALSLLSGLGLTWLVTDNVIRLGKWIAHEPLEDIREWVKDATEAVNFCKLAAFQYDVGVHVIEPILTKLVAAQEWYCTLDGDTLPIGCTPKPGYLGAWEPIGTPTINHPQVSKRLAPDLPLPQRTIV